MLTAAPSSIGLSYDPLLRLRQIGTVSAATQFAYDGLDMIAEHDLAGTLQRRFVHGPDTDDPIAWYEGSGTTDRRFLSSDERGSIVAVTDGAGALLRINSYDEYGIPGANNLGRFGYTGQAWLGEIGMQYSKARIYSPTLGRFLQTDPIGPEDSPNLYQYVLNDPVNFTDPLGLLLGCDANTTVCGTYTGGLSPLMNPALFNSAGDDGRAGPPITIIASLRRPPNARGVRVGGGDKDPRQGQCPAIKPRSDIGGNDLFGAAVLDPAGFLIAVEVYNLANAAADERYGSLPSQHGQFRHVFAAVALTRLLGAERARAVLNAGEVSGKNPLGERIQDNYNNDLGIALASDPRNRGVPTGELAENSVNQGCVK